MTEVSYLGFVHGTMAALARCAPAAGAPSSRSARRWRTQRPPAVRLLRRQARHQRIHLLAALRAAAREHRRAGHRGADASGQHAAVLLGAVPAAQHPQPVPPIYQPEVAARGRLVRRRHPAAASTGSAAPWLPSSPTVRPAPCWTGTWPAPATAPSRPRRRSRRAAPITCSTRSTGPTDTITARAGSSTTSPTTGAALWIAQHARLPSGLLAGAAVARAFVSRDGADATGDGFDTAHEGGSGRRTSAPDGPGYLRGGARSGSAPTIRIATCRRPSRRACRCRRCSSGPGT